MDFRPLNEEQIKNNLILPMLYAMGFSAGELEFENTFQIQLGRGVYSINGATGKASGRLDVLCRRNGLSLFVIELKAESEPLTDADLRQGLSYARLLEPMAPYVLLSNGVATEIYETVRGQRVDGSRPTLLAGLQPGLQAEVGLRFEALKHFVSLSRDNLLAFCKTHNEATLASFRANPNDHPAGQLQRKYIPATYVFREVIEASFRMFLMQSNHTVFPVIGPSGVGKTNTMCFLAESSSDEPNLFYSGTLLGPSFLSLLSMDFNLTFSAQETPVSLLKKISAFGETHGKTMTIFLDAIDEWESPEKVAELGLVVMALRQFRMRLVVSCKSSNWDEFLTRKGVPSAIKEVLFPNVPQLSDFSSTEFSVAVEKYCKFLSLTTPATPSVYDFHNPFALRIACEVAYNSKIQLDMMTESRENIRQYLSQKFAKSRDHNACWRLIVALAAAMEELDQVQVEEVRLRDNLNIGILDEIPPDLFDHGILLRFVNESGTAFIGFYFSTVRDYLVACKVRRLDEANPAERVERLGNLLRSYIGQSSVLYFFRTGSVEDRRACLEAALTADSANGTHHVADLLGWHGRLILRDLSEQEHERLLRHLETTLFTNPNDYGIAERVVDIVSQLGVSPAAEVALVDWLYRFAEIPELPCVSTSHQISELLHRRDTPAQTRRLLALATDSTKDGYVRRYAVAALRGRSIPDARAAFLALIQDSNPNVRTWARGWYGSLEDAALREAMFGLLRAELPPTVHEDVALSLGHSRLPDTGERLFEWFTSLPRAPEDRRHEGRLGWVCRALAELQYRPAIPEFIRRLKERPQTRLGDHLVRLGDHLIIALGDLRAKEALPDLLDLLEQDKVDPYWCAGAMVRVLDEESRSVIREGLKRGGAAGYACLLALAMGATEDVEDYVISFVLDPTNPKHRRSELLSTWGMAIMGYVAEGVGQIHRSQPGRPASEKFRSALFTIVSEHGDTSPLALMLLISLEDDVEKLFRTIAQEVPKFRSPLVGRETHKFDMGRLTELGHRLRPWLDRQLASPATPPALIQSCLVLANFVGDIGTYEAIQSNRSNVETTANPSLLSELEGRIRSGPPPRSLSL